MRTAVLDGLELLVAAASPLPRRAGLAGLRFVWNAGSDAAWNSAVARASAGRMRAEDILMAADGVAADPASRESKLLLAVDSLCSETDGARAKTRAAARFGARTRSALTALAASAMTLPATVPPAAQESLDGGGWLFAVLLSATLANRTDV